MGEPGDTGGISRGRIAVVAFLCAVAGVWLYWPALGLGYHLDDYVHIATLEGAGVMPGKTWYELFTFVVPGSDRLGPIQGDYVPWWGAEDLLLRFFRPLSGLTYAIDYALWGDDPVGFHATNLVLYAGLIVGSVLFFARLAQLSGRGIWTVLLAGLVFALAREHEGSVSWIAGRNTLVSIFFCPLALLAYHRWRTSKRRRDLALALALFGLGLLSNETPVALSGFYFAYEVSLARDRIPDRVRGILPMALLAVAWLAFFSLAGYGAKNSDWYVNPITHFGRFLDQGLTQNLPLYVLDLTLPGALEPRFAGHAGHFVPWLLALFPSPGSMIAVATYTLLGAFVVHAAVDRTVRFALVGTLASLVPLAASPTAARVLLLPTIGMSWVFAAFATTALAKLRRPRSLLRPWNAGAVLLAAALLATLASDPGIARHLVREKASWAHNIHARTMELELPTGDERIVLVTAPSGQEALILPLIRLKEGLGLPAGIWGLTASEGVYTFTRTSERGFRLDLYPEGRPAGMIPKAWSGLYRDDFDFSVGQRFERGVLHVELADVGPGGTVYGIDVELDRPLGDPDVWLMVFRDRAWARLEVPAVGESIVLPTLPAR